MCISRKSSWSWQWQVPLKGLRSCKDMKCKKRKTQEKKWTYNFPDAVMPGGSRTTSSALGLWLWSCSDQITTSAAVVRSKGRFCERSGDWVGMCCDSKGALLLPFLHPTNLSLQARGDTSLRICLNNGHHHPEAALEFPPTSVNSAFGFPVASLDPSLAVQKPSAGITADVELAARKSRPSRQAVLWKSLLPFRLLHPL